MSDLDDELDWLDEWRGRRGRDDDEQDAFTSWRRVLYWRPGERKRIKQRANRRERRQVRQPRAAAAELTRMRAEEGL